MSSCCFGPCDQSQKNGGPGCHLCDTSAPLAGPQERAGTFAVPDPKFKKAAKHPSQKKKHRVGPHR